jgi:hypothetical protein
MAEIPSGARPSVCPSARTRLSDAPQGHTDVCIYLGALPPRPRHTAVDAALRRTLCTFGPLGPMARVALINRFVPGSNRRPLTPCHTATIVGLLRVLSTSFILGFKSARGLPAPVPRRSRAPYTQACRRMTDSD